MKILLTVLIGIIQGIIYFIPQDKVLDKRSKSLKSITSNGWKIILCCSFTIIATIILFLISESESKDFNRQLEKRDSLSEIARKKESEKYIEKLKESNVETRNALLEYGYEMDSTSMKIEKIVNQKDTVNKIPDPYLTVRDIKIKNQDAKEAYLELPFYSYDATSYHPEIIMTILTKDSKNNLKIFFKGDSILSKRIAITKDNSKIANFTLWNLQNDFQEIYFYLRGFYRKSPYGKKIKMDNIYCYRIKDSVTTQLQIWDEQRLRKFINSNK